MRNSSDLHLHLVHPRSVPWSTISKELAAAFNLPLVPYPKWFSALERSALANANSSDIEFRRNNPAAKMLGAFRGILIGLEGNTNRNKEFTGLPLVSLENAMKVSPTLRDKNLLPLGSVDVEQWLTYWRTTVLLQSKL
jgi:hypothetical protein